MSQRGLSGTNQTNMTWMMDGAAWRMLGSFQHQSVPSSQCCSHFGLPNVVESIEERPQTSTFLRMTKFAQKCRTGNDAIHDPMSKYEPGEDPHSNCRGQHVFQLRPQGVTEMLHTINTETLQNSARHHKAAPKHNTSSSPQMIRDKSNKRQRSDCAQVIAGVQYAEERTIRFPEFLKPEIQGLQASPG
jgi:hypothetical protein